MTGPFCATGAFEGLSEFVFTIGDMLDGLPEFALEGLPVFADNLTIVGKRLLEDSCACRNEVGNEFMFLDVLLWFL